MIYLKEMEFIYLKMEKDMKESSIKDKKMLNIIIIFIMY